MDTIVGTALMLVIFLGIAAAFQLSIDVVTNNKARGSAVALAGERMEYIRSLSYASIGTSGGIPAGSIAQSEIVTLNGIPFTRRTTIAYVDDSKDGTGVSDSNGITADYKTVKVDVAWTSRTGTRDIVLVSRIEPSNGMEIACPPLTPCGTLTINVGDASSQPLSGASVSITNSSVVPAISISTFTNTSGVASFVGAPVSGGYQIVVTKTGYSTAQTYSVSNPNPGALSVLSSQTTSGTFFIDVLGQKTIQTWTQILSGTWTDTFADTTKIDSSSTTTVASGIVRLTGSSGTYPSTGTFRSIAIAPASLNTWKSFSAATSTPAQTSIRFRFYDASGTTLIPDSAIPGNSAGVATSTISLLGVSTSTYPSLVVGATLASSDPAATPSIDSYSILYDYGPTPLPSIAFTMQGAKTIGSDGSGPIYKYSQNLNSGSGSSLLISNLEYDTYTLSVNGTATGYDIASVCHPQSEYLAQSASTTRFSFSPGVQSTSAIYLAAHTTNSLLVDVRAASNGNVIPGASVSLWKVGTATTTVVADSCGQAFFSGLSAATYSVSSSVSGYTTYWGISAAPVSGVSKFSVPQN